MGEKEEKQIVKQDVFSLEPQKSFLPKMGRKWACLIDKNANVQLHMGFIRTLLFFTFFFFSWMLPSFFLFLIRQSLSNVQCSYYFFIINFFLSCVCVCVFFRCDFFFLDMTFIF